MEEKAWSYQAGEDAFVDGGASNDSLARAGAPSVSQSGLCSFPLPLHDPPQGNSAELLSLSSPGPHGFRFLTINP